MVYITSNIECVPGSGKMNYQGYLFWNRSLEGEAMFEWTKKMSIDNSFIDEDHQKLIDIANHVIGLNHPGYDPEELKLAIRELYDYVKYHFKREESFMAEIGYPALAEHHEKHATIIKDMNHYLTTSHHMGEMLENFQQLMNTWVINHIMEEDCQLHKFLHSKQDSG